ncbi:MAG: hypothetical protein HQK49_15415 [Oligoflexia bacterium]|nr:hypothetical protein [Oligoflexia bacterium]
MSKDSIRNKIDKLKEESKEILKSDNISKEVSLFITSMMVLIDIIVDVLFTKKVRKNSSNSGVPSAQNFASNGNRNNSNDSDKKKKGSQLPNTRNVTEEILVAVKDCKGCGVDLSSDKPIDTETRIEIDIVYEIRKKEVYIVS